jgi:hypothetical protein
MTESENLDEKTLTSLSSEFTAQADDADLALVVRWDPDLEGWKIQAISGEDQVTSAGGPGAGGLILGLMKVFVKLEPELEKYRKFDEIHKAELAALLSEDEDDE